MILDVEVDASGPQRQLAEMADRVKSRSLMTVLARGLEEYQREAFATRGFGAWPRNDADTLEQKSGARVLVDTGALMRELTHAEISFAGDAVTVDQGGAFHARFHRDGAGAEPRRNPAPRPTSRHVQKWADQLVGYIVTGKGYR